MTTASPRSVALKILDRYEPGKTNLSALMARRIEGPDAPREKGFTRDLVWGVVRYLYALDFLIDRFATKPQKLEPQVRNILRLGTFQLLFFEGKVPEYAAVNESVALARASRRSPAASLVNAVLRGIIREKDKLPWPDENADPATAIAVRFSHPEWLVKRWIKRWGNERTKELCAADNETPPLAIRVNTLKITRNDLQKRLEGEGVASRPAAVSPDGLILDSRPVIENLEAYRRGLFIVQDEASQIVSFLLDAREGGTVLDLCSGAGIKAAHIAQITRGKAKLVAVDLSETQVRRSRENFERLGVTGVEMLKEDALAIRGPAADRVLLDAPCSGFGAVRRKPDIKWNRSESDVVSRLPELQKKMIARAASLVMPGGKLVYSTCTTEPEENEEVVEYLLGRFPDLAVEKPGTDLLPGELVTPEGYFRSFPHEHDMDGFFAAVLRRK